MKLTPTAGLTPDNSFEGINERLLRARHEARRVGTQRHVDAVHLLRRRGDDVFRFVAARRLDLAERALVAFRKLWHEAPVQARGATFSPAELEGVVKAARSLDRVQGAR